MLTDQQCREFYARGFTRVRYAVPVAAVERMLARIWRALEERYGFRSDDSTTWVAGGVRGIGDLNREPEFRPFGSPSIQQAIDGLLGKDNWRMPSSWGQILATFPADQWCWNSLFQGQTEVSTITWHTDYPYTALPDKLAGVQIFCLLADIDSGGGSTLVIEGSHRVIARFVQSERAETLQKMKRARVALLRSHPWFGDVSNAISQPRPESWIQKQQADIDGIPVAVRELTGSACDVYFTHPWLLHAASPNCNSAPRLMCTQRIHHEGLKSLARRQRP